MPLNGQPRSTQLPFRKWTMVLVLVLALVQAEVDPNHLVLERPGRRLHGTTTPHPFYFCFCVLSQSKQLPRTPCRVSSCV